MVIRLLFIYTTGLNEEKEIKYHYNTRNNFTSINSLSKYLLFRGV